MHKSYGPFKSVDDLLALRGIGPKRLEKMRKYLTVGKYAAGSSKKPTANSALPAKCPDCAKSPPSKKEARTPSTKSPPTGAAKKTKIQPSDEEDDEPE
jgi:Helix-hairpin-helix motif